MQTVASRAELIEDLPQQVPAMLELFHPRLLAREADIKSVKTKTFKYGSTDRHQLDVYYPSTTTSNNGKAPVLFFAYGGGYASGARNFRPPYQLIYSNVGAFFASQGLVTVIADYRLHPDIKFPDPSSDIRDAFVFVARHSDEINAAVPVPADIDNVFFMGHSAGAAVVATMMLLPAFVPKDLRPCIRGIVLQGGAYHYRSYGPDDPFPPPAVSYFGSEEGCLHNEPLALLDRAPEDLIRELPPIILYRSEMEPKNVEAMSVDFRQALNARLGSDVRLLVMKGHNHVSPHHSLFTGEGEEWGYEVASWIKSKGRALL